MTLHELMMAIAVVGCTTAAVVEAHPHGLGWGWAFAAGGLAVGCLFAWGIQRSVFWIVSLDSRYPRGSTLLAFLALPLMFLGPPGFTLWLAQRAASHI